jgi:Holliday junction resolvase-like predicted endonuclease
MISLEEIKNLILKGKTLEEILEKFDWKEFEATVFEIFVANNFFVKKNFRFKTKQKYELDIVATKGNFVVCADCKDWSSGRYKKTALRYSVEKQEKRIEELKKFLRNNLIAKKMLKIGSKPVFVSLIISLLQEDIVIEGKTVIVPVEKLNTFLVELETHV